MSWVHGARGKAPPPRVRIPTCRIPEAREEGGKKDRRIYSVRSCKPVLRGLRIEGLVREHSRHREEEKVNRRKAQDSTSKRRERCTGT